MKKELVISSTEFETRLAMIENGRLVELQVERPDSDRMVGDIYKGNIKTVLPGMQAAFVDIGMERAAYLHSSDIGKVYKDRFGSDVADEEEAPAEIIRKTRRAGIETVLKRNQDILVQVIKEPISNKGPRIASEISLPGRYLVMVPDDDHIRLSKRISDWGEKKRLRKIVEPLRPEGFGLIIRTEGEGKQEADFRADIKRLLRLWTKLKRKADTMPAPALIHKEAEMIVSMIRDVFTDDVEKVLVDNREDYKKIISYARQVAPHLKKRVELHRGEQPLFDLYKLEGEIDKMLSRKVWIKKGAYLIIDQTEAMVTIDVNTGRFVGRRDQEDTIFQTNLLAAQEIAQQVRLRDIGGLIVCDFIDMYNRDNRRKLYEAFCAAFKYDRAKRGINPVTEFGLIEMTRERVRPSHMHQLSEQCPCCDGLGRIMSKDNIATKIERWFTRAKAARKHRDFHLVITPDQAVMMMDGAVDRIQRVMKAHKFRINVIRDSTLAQTEYRMYETEHNTEITEMYDA
ncbi:MAG: Rne/Rng family ribonuclease [candidate division Zixibacteria bacterium]|nr:Rne/Rng family ribonuclease [candidate division Zixibacteria bacterium]